MKHTLVIVGAGLAGLSAALTAVKNGWTVKLVSSLASCLLYTSDAADE